MVKIKKIRASSIVETVVSMALIVLIFLLAGSILAVVVHSYSPSSKLRLKSKLIQVLNAYSHDAYQIDNLHLTQGYQVIERPYKGEKHLRLLVVYAIDKDGNRIDSILGIKTVNTEIEGGTINE